jgi:hypothetical protein
MSNEAATVDTPSPAAASADTTVKYKKAFVGTPYAFIEGITQGGRHYTVVRFNDTLGLSRDLVTPDSDTINQIKAAGFGPVALTEVTYGLKSHHLKKAVLAQVKDAKKFVFTKGSGVLTGDAAWNEAAKLVFLNNDDDGVDVTDLGRNARAAYDELVKIGKKDTADASSFEVQLGNKTREYFIVRATADNGTNNGTVWAAIFDKAADREVAKITTNNDGEFVGAWLGAAFTHARLPG